uniref:Protein maelstrom homolog n=1 Tax=Branchiostoma floridae TaxID=7739 RepID=C3Z277_BRAFL|eukprot:XP_002597116.1 hypothetical protein BRAFLDRAFT_121310 [Branchiostoma floridae]
MPPKKKNKPQRNGFWVYMQEMIPEYKRQGYQMPNGMADVVKLAHPSWKAMPEMEKQEYERQAKELKKSASATAGRLDCKGRPLADRVDTKAILEKRRLEERRRVVAAWPPGRGVVHEKFFLLSIQSLCELPDDMGYMPCEIGVVEYSLQEGITREFHRFIQPGKPPLGYRYLCQSTSDNTHQIPIEGFELAEGDYHRLWTDLCKFTSPNGRDFPPLYVQVTHTSMCEWCLDWLSEMAGEYNRFHVYELDSLVKDLYEHGEGHAPSLSMIASILNTSVFDYEDGSSCEYHASKEVKYCALGAVKRFCFSISDSMAQVYDLQLTARHLPERPENQGHYTILPSDAFALDRRPMWDPPSRQRTTSQPRGAAYNPPPSYSRDQRNGIAAASASEGNFPARDIREFTQASHSASSSSVPETQALRKPTTPGFVAQLSGAVVAGLGRGRGRGTLGLTPEQMRTLTASGRPQPVGGLQQQMAGLTVHSQPTSRENLD